MHIYVNSLHVHIYINISASGCVFDFRNRNPACGQVLRSAPASPRAFDEARKPGMLVTWQKDVSEPTSRGRGLSKHLSLSRGPSRV